MIKGNVRISELQNLDDVTGKEILPVSQKNADGYATYKLDINAIADYINNVFDVEDTKVNVATLTSDLGQYDGEIHGTRNTIQLKISQPLGAIEYSKDGKDIITPSFITGYSIYGPIDVKAGTLYLLEVKKDIADNISVFSKIHNVTSYKTTGYSTTTNADGNSISVPKYTTQTQTYYETLPHHYIENGATSGTHKYVIYLATEDCQICISAPSDSGSDYLGRSVMYAVKYATIVETADRYIGANTNMTRTICEALANLSARIESCEKNIGTIHNAIVNEIDSLEMYKYRGGQLVTTSENTVGEPTEIPNHKGQIIFVGDIAYIATDAGDNGHWVQITNL